MRRSLRGVPRRDLFDRFLEHLDETERLSGHRPTVVLFDSLRRARPLLTVAMDRCRFVAAQVPEEDRQRELLGARYRLVGVIAGVEILVLAGVSRSSS